MCGCLGNGTQLIVGLWGVEGVLVWKASVCKCHYGIEMFGEATERRKGMER